MRSPEILHHFKSSNHEKMDLFQKSSRTIMFEMKIFIYLVFYLALWYCSVRTQLLKVFVQIDANYQFKRKMKQKETLNYPIN